MNELRFGAQMYNAREFCKDTQGMRASLAKVKDIGYKVVQLSGHGKDIPMEAIADMLTELNLECRATHIAFEEMQARLPEVLERHKLWNCPYIGIGGLPAEYRSREGYSAFAQEASQIARKIADNGMTFIYHNHAFELEKFSDGSTGLGILIDECSDDIMFEFDVYWLQAGGANPVRWIEKMAGRVDVLHFKEMVGGADNCPHMAPIGWGNMDWHNIISAARAAGAKYALLEQDDSGSRDPFECFKLSYDSMISYRVSP